MMTATIYEWPHDWYRFTRTVFAPRSSSQVAARPWAGGRNVYGPHAQLWIANLTLAPQRWDVEGRAMSAFMSRLNGQSGLIRIGHGARVQGQYNVEAVVTREEFSDDTLFSDGTGFLSGTLPSTVIVAEAAARGATSLVVGGLPASLSSVLRRGDLLEIRPGGVAASYPHLYEVMVDGSTDGDGETGVEIRPPLRRSVASGDQIVLSYPTSVFRLMDDDQGSVEVDAARIAGMGFSLIEAVDLV